MPSQAVIGRKFNTRRRRCIRRCVGCFCGVLALLCIAVGVGITFAFDYVFQEQLKVMMPLANGSMSYRGWSEPPNKITFQIWLWNITNPKEVIMGQRPVLQQVGPFAFAERRYKANITFYPNDTVSFFEYQQFFYLPEKSCGNISELMITSVNMPYAVTSIQMKAVSPFMRNIAGRMFAQNSGGLFITRPASEILHGYKDGALSIVEGMVRRFLPHMPFQSTSGLFIGTNNTHKGQFLVHTGRGNLSSFNRVQRWNGEPELSVWPEKSANKIVGTDGSMFGPGVTSSSKLDIFSTDICLSLHLVYEKPADIEGIPALGFRPSPEIMLNATLRPENKAFCSESGCLDSGVLNISLCKGGVPLAISSPHFTNAPTYAKAVIGVSPSEEEFGTAICIEPNTGFVINAQRRMQMNIMLERISGFTDTEKLIDPMLMMPLMWLNESGRIDPVSAELFKAHLLAPIQIVALAQWVIIAVGIVWISAVALTCSLLARRRRRRRQNRPSRQIVLNRISDDSDVTADAGLIRKLQDPNLRESNIV
ncbi:hypothetical protein BOX15_Mlig014140g2 [Macrostomum lignano]|uniref:Lysosome membrane protein 2 n=2 Tax=Macrostomum lignano TaxID=282301 RepID=A0A267EZK2_9PLAT|nr:hypothetical protein BOX15_Mlig014140g2 [Macrostomum lignano]